MSGRHARASRRFLPAVAATLLAALLLAAAVAALRLRPIETTDEAVPLAPAATAGTPSPAPERPVDRAGRSELRPAPPAVSPSPPAPAPPAPAPAPSRSPSAAPRPVVSTGTCQASFYEDGQRTANGEIFDPNALTAAHKTLPFNTKVRVTNLANGKSVVVRINDRGPFVTGRCLDLTRGAFAVIASLNSGVANVKYEILG